MKLRNKKTQEIRSIEEIIRDAFLSNELDLLKNIDADWEEIEPKEPLIKDPKIRKAVRAWAEVNSIDKIIIFDCINDSPYTSAGEVKFAEFGGCIDIRLRTDEKFNTGKIYTIEELCGEEE